MKFLLLALLALMPINTFGNELHLRDFFAPKNGSTNSYNCEFPCEKIEVSGKLLEGEKAIELTEVMFFSDELTKNNPNFPQVTSILKMLHLLEGEIVMGNPKSGTILLKAPLKNSTSWYIGGIAGQAGDKKELTTLEPVKFSLRCEINNISRETLFEEERDVVTVKCLPQSQSSPYQEISWWRYASGIGLIEYKTEHRQNNGRISQKTIMAIVKHESKAGKSD